MDDKGYFLFHYSQLGILINLCIADPRNNQHVKIVGIVETNNFYK